MNNTERALNILQFKPVDRMPAVHFGYWSELLEEWAEQGHISKELSRSIRDSNEADKELDRLLGWDFNWQNIKSGEVGLYPAFERKILEKLPNGFLRVQNYQGLIERVKEGIESIPAEDDYQLKDREAFESLYKEKMQFKPERIPYAYFEKEFNREEKTGPVGLNLGSIFGSIRDMLSVVGMSYLMCDDFELLQEIVDTYAEMQYQCTEEVLKTGAKFDFAHYWEDICFKNGPLLSPSMFEELCGKHYKKRNDLVRSYGIDIISLDCDGVTEALQPIWFKNGVNTLFPIEIGTWGDQFEKARTHFGKELRGVGGVNKLVLREDKGAVDEELKRIEKLVKLGGFLPCPDHRLMPGTRFELVQYYIEKIKEIKVASF
ncbi:hypothetical protein CS063_03755 [Sporanaerobium hydrogeniformans]|uniref:Uncharacterized protein n=1 Tax=Sporanaerobium hydrogeniformans TaxID=3072179 RepID=A0AC61DF61_9FIRM|nr:uroporphyrinogen decarboxylase family protein [Sporanaerobium hydrogeniformans]PHV71688.1 hypothetical protein CS063_03755 [Sporanaerobium hydrogeniformans]